MIGLCTRASCVCNLFGPMWAGLARVTSMSNVAGKAYAMNVITPMRPGLTWVQTTIFSLARLMPTTLGGLLGLKLIHFARWLPWQIWH